MSRALSAARLLAACVAAVVFLGGPLTAAGNRPQPQAWTLVPAQSDVRIHVSRDSSFGFAGHDHEIVAPSFFGSLRIDPDSPGDTVVRIVFQAAALKLSGRGENPQDIPEIQMTMLGPRVLDVEQYPTITFMSRAIQPAADAAPETQADVSRYTVSGDLSLHGVTRVVELPVTVQTSNTDILASGSVSIRQTDFGIQPVTAAMGTIKIKDELIIQFKLDAQLDPQ
ncbi:MAG TPA: YceI family protein [Vicinamibacterales bacterium]|jgi:polyisoprenoid-binding protein YceI